MTVARAAVGYRLQIRETVGTPASGEDIQNINTLPLPDGAQCFVNLNRGLYQLDKGSTLAASGWEVVVPIAGPGRWILQSGPGLQLFAALNSSQGLNNSFTVDGDWSALSTSNFVVSQFGSYWALTAAGGILTYSGPPAPAKLQLMASVAVNGGTPPYSNYAGIRVNGQLTGSLAGAQGGVLGANFVQADTDDIAQAIMSQRFLSELLPGDTVQPVFGSTATGEPTGVLYSMQLLITAP